MNNEQIKLCKTKPIFRRPQINLNPYITNGYDNNSDFLQMQKQTQTKPILSASADKIVPSAVEGPIISMVYTADKFALSLPNGPIENSCVAGKIALPALECLPAFCVAGRCRGSVVEGPVVSLSNPFYIMQKATGLKLNNRYNKTVV